MPGLGQERGETPQAAEETRKGDQVQRHAAWWAAALGGVLTFKSRGVPRVALEARGGVRPGFLTQNLSR